MPEILLHFDVFHVHCDYRRVVGDWRGLKLYCLLRDISTVLLEVEIIIYEYIRRER